MPDYEPPGYDGPFAPSRKPMMPPIPVAPMRWHCTTCGHEWPRGTYDTHVCADVIAARSTTRAYTQSEMDEMNQRLIDRTQGLLSKIAEQGQEIRRLKRKETQSSRLAFELGVILLYEHHLITESFARRRLGVASIVCFRLKRERLLQSLASSEDLPTPSLPLPLP